MNEPLYPNLLLVGSRVETAALLPLILAACRKPVCEVPSGRVDQLPASGTIIMRDVSALDHCQQQTLLAWLAGHSDRLQVVTIAPDTLFSRVQDGTLVDALFYRLNIITLTAVDLADAMPVPAADLQMLGFGTADPDPDRLRLLLRRASSG
jgi:hypothetical protein